VLTPDSVTERRSGTERRQIDQSVALDRRARLRRSEDGGVQAEWEDVRCRHCKRLLAKITRDALTARAMAELKCGSCNTLNYLVGHVDEATT
jgi:phage FluMu protein Com